MDRENFYEKAEIEYTRIFKVLFCNYFEKKYIYTTRNCIEKLHKTLTALYFYQ